MEQLQVIQSKIYEIRGQKVMLDFDLASLYGTETKYLKRSVKNNLKRFPSDFMFELTKEEWDFLRCSFCTLNEGRGKHPKYMPYAFTELGVSMLSSILNSELAIEINIGIMRAFVAVRQMIALPPTKKTIRTAKRSIRFESLHRRSSFRPKRHQRRNCHAIGINQPILGRITDEKEKRRTTPQSNRVYSI